MYIGYYIFMCMKSIFCSASFKLCILRLSANRADNWREDAAGGQKLSAAVGVSE